MSTAERRTKYVSGRILIEAERILVPQFVAQGIFLSGAQVELLRNVVAYLGRDTTFVDEYHGGYYLTVTEEDWDDIQSIVASLEEKLMVNDNTMWGYSAPLHWREIEGTDGSDPFHVSGGEVPAGELWVIESFTVRHNQGSDITVLLNNTKGVTEYPVLGTLTIPTGVFYGGAIAVTLAAGDELIAAFNGVSTGKVVQFIGLGYKMHVPE